MRRQAACHAPSVERFHPDSTLTGLGAYVVVLFGLNLRVHGRHEQYGIEAAKEDNLQRKGLVGSHPAPYTQCGKVSTAYRLLHDSIGVKSAPLPPSLPHESA